MKLENDKLEKSFAPKAKAKEWFSMSKKEAKHYIKQEKQLVEVNGVYCRRWELIWPSESAMKEYYNELSEEV